MQSLAQNTEGDATATLVVVYGVTLIVLVLVAIRFIPFFLDELADWIHQLRTKWNWRDFVVGLWVLSCFLMGIVAGVAFIVVIIVAGIGEITYALRAEATRVRLDDGLSAPRTGSVESRR